MKCVVCGAEFSKRTSPKQITCSKECSRKRHYQMQRARISKPFHICHTCGKKFRPTPEHRSTIYCSDECKAQKSKRVPAPKDAHCKFCGKPFHREYGQQKYCSVRCRNASKCSHPVRKPPEKPKIAEKPRVNRVDDINTQAREMGLSYGAFQALQWQQEHRYKIV